MTQVKIDIGKLDANGIVDLGQRLDQRHAHKPLRHRHQKRSWSTNRSRPRSTSTAPITLNLPPTGKDWAYQLHVGAGTQHEFKVTFDVPDSANPVNFADLVTVDPATLIPNAGNPLSDINQSDIDWAVDAINA